MENLMKGARTVVTHCLNIKPYEKVSVITDTKLLKIGEAIYTACREVNFDTILLVMEPTGRDGAEPPKVVAEAMKASDVVIAPTLYSMTHTRARIEASKIGVRVVNMPNVSEFSFSTGGLTADYTDVKRLTDKMFLLVKHSHNIEVKSANGTDVKLSVDKQEWYKDTGIIHKPKDKGNLPGGEVFVAPVENSVNGTIVFDSFRLADDGLKLEIKDGKVIKTIGNAQPLMKIFDQFGSKAKLISEFGIGTNPKARIIGNTLEDEKVMGSVHFALGSNYSFGGKNKIQFHKDGIISKPSVKIDNRLIIENGKWKI
jgi:aminopeptidase